MEDRKTEKEDASAPGQPDGGVEMSLATVIGNLIISVILILLVILGGGVVLCSGAGGGGIEVLIGFLIGAVIIGLAFFGLIKTWSSSE